MGQTRDGRQLGIPGFGLSVGTFAEQTETIEVHYPELNLARTAVLDYFQSPMQKHLLKIFTWENHFVLHPGRNTIQLLRNVSSNVCWLVIFNPSVVFRYVATLHRLFLLRTHCFLMFSQSAQCSSRTTQRFAQIVISLGV